MTDTLPEPASPAAKLRSARPLSRTLVDHVPCRHCGYDLMGLPGDGDCPECGTSILGSNVPSRSSRRTVSVRHGHLGDAPLSYLIPLQLGLLGLAFGIVGTMISARLVASADFSPVLALAFLALSLVWVFSTMLVVRRRPLDAPDEPGPGATPLPPEWWRLRLVACVGTALVPCACLLLALAARSGSGGFLIAAWAVTLLSAPGHVATSVLVSRLADWGTDEPTIKRMRLATWGLVVFPVFAALMSLLALVMNTPLPNVLASFATIGWTLSGLLMAGLCLMFQGTISWARRNSIERDERDARLAERRARATAELASRIPEPLDPAPAMSEPLPAAPLRAASEDFDLNQPLPKGAQVIVPQKDVKPYSIED